MRNRNSWRVVLIAAAALMCVAAEKTFTDPEKSGPDYAVQGEYEGTSGAAKDKIGVQVVANGDGKFDAYFLAGGLPGAGFDGKGRTKVSGTKEGDATTFKATGDSGFSATIKGEQLTGTNLKGEPVEAKKVSRQSPTMGAKPPEGAIVMFDGTNTDAWEKGRMDDRKILLAGATSKQKFRDFTIHVEFMLPFKPFAHGQERGNSGLYLQKRYEVQILDSFGLSGANNECGGIYQVSACLTNMCFPPLTWQTYDVDFEAAKFENGKKTKNAVVSVKQNGVLVQDKKEIPGPTGGGEKESAEPGAFYLQDHGNPVVFRNIWIVEKK